MSFACHTVLLPVYDEVAKYEGGDLHKSRQRETQVPVLHNVTGTQCQNIIHHTVYKPGRKRKDTRVQTCDAVNFNWVQNLS